MSHVTVKERDKENLLISSIVTAPFILIAILMDNDTQTFAFLAVAVAVFNMFKSWNRLDIAKQLEKELLECRESKNRN